MTARGLADATRLDPASGWPPLFPTYDAMVASNTPGV